MADQDHSGEGAGNQYGEQQMYAQDGGYDNGPSGDSGQELKKKDDDDRFVFMSCCMSRGLHAILNLLEFWYFTI